MTESLNNANKWPAFVDTLFGDMTFVDPESPDPRAIGMRIRQMAARDPLTGKNWACADITFVVENDQGEPIARREFHVGQGEPDEPFVQEFVFDVDAGGLIAQPGLSYDEVAQMHADCNEGIQALRQYGTMDQ